MKALKSSLATKLLDDLEARGELRNFLFAKSTGSVAVRDVKTGQFQLGRGTSEAPTIKAVLVPKAKTA